MKNIDHFNWKLFSEYLTKLLKFYSKISIFPIKAETAEELLYTVFKKMGEKPRWDQGSHKPGADIWCKSFDISVKSGTIKKTEDVVQISSYRLTRFDDLEEIKDFLTNDKNFDIYICVAREEFIEKRIYRVFILDKDVFNAKDAEWTETFIQNGKRKGKSSGWRGKSPNKVIGNIHKSMSNQLWLEIPLSEAKEILYLEINKEDLGSHLENFFK